MSMLPDTYPQRHMSTLPPGPPGHHAQPTQRPAAPSAPNSRLALPRRAAPLHGQDSNSSHGPVRSSSAGGQQNTAAAQRPCLFSLLDLLSTEDCTTPTQRAALRAILQDFLLNKLTQERVWTFIGQVIGYQVLAECIKHLTAKQNRSTTSDSVNAASLARIDSAFGICNILGSTQSQLSTTAPMGATTTAPQPLTGTVPLTTVASTPQDTSQNAINHITDSPTTNESFRGTARKDAGTATASSQPSRTTASDGTDTIVGRTSLAARVDSIKNLFSNMEWTNRLPSYQTPRLTYGQATVLFENKFFILGGLSCVEGDDSEQATFGNICLVNVWDLQSRIVPTHGSPPPSLAGHTATLIDHSCTGAAPYILVYGGIQAGNNTCNDKVYRLDLAKRIWTESQPLGKAGTNAAPRPRTGHSAVLWPPRADSASRFLHSVGTDVDTVLLTEMVIIYGGRSPKNTVQEHKHTMADVDYNNEEGFDYLNDMWVFNLSNNTWTEIIMPTDYPLPAPRANAALFWRDDCTLCLYGGESVSTVKPATGGTNELSTSIEVLHSDVWNCNVSVRPVDKKSLNYKNEKQRSTGEGTTGKETDTALSAENAGKSTSEHTGIDGSSDPEDITGENENNGFEDGTEDLSRQRKRRRRNSHTVEPVDKQMRAGSSPQARVPAVGAGDGTDSVSHEGVEERSSTGVEVTSSVVVGDVSAADSTTSSTGGASSSNRSSNDSGAVAVVVGEETGTIDVGSLKASKRRRVEGTAHSGDDECDDEGEGVSVAKGTTATAERMSDSESTHAAASAVCGDDGVPELYISVEWDLDEACSRGGRPRAGHTVLHLKIHGSWKTPVSDKSSTASNILLVLGGVTTKQINNTEHSSTTSMNDDTTTSNSDVCTRNGTTGTSIISSASVVAGSDSATNTTREAVTSTAEVASSGASVYSRSSKLVQCCTRDVDIMLLPNTKATVPYDVCLWTTVQPNVGFSTFEDVAHDEVVFAARTQATVQFFVANAQTGKKSAPCVFVSAGVDASGKQLTDSILLSLTGEDSYAGLLMDHSEFLGSSYSSRLLPVPNASRYRHVAHTAKPESKINANSGTEVARATGLPATTVLGHGISVDGLAASVQAAIRQTPLWLTKPVITPGIFWSLGGVSRWAFSSIGSLLENSLKSCVASTKVAIGVERDLNVYAGNGMRGLDRSGFWIQDNGVGLDYQSLHKLLKKVSSFTPGDRQTRADEYGIGFKLACSRLASSCMVITRTKSVVGAGMLSQRLLSHFDAQVVVAPVCMWRLPKKELVTCGFPCADMRHSQRTLMSYSPFSSPTVIAGEMNKLGHLTGTRIVFWDIRKDLPYLQRDDSGVVVLRSDPIINEQQQNNLRDIAETAAAQPLAADNTSMSDDTQNVPAVTHGTTGAGTDTERATRRALPVSFPLWTSAEYSLNHCLPTYLFWSFIKRQPAFELDGLRIEVPQVDVDTLTSEQGTGGEPSKCLHDYLKLRLHKMVELPYLTKPSELDSYGLVGFLNNGNEKDSERVCEAGILLYYRQRLIRRLNSRIPDSNNWELEQSLLSENGKTAHLEDQRRLNDIQGDSIVIPRRNQQTFDWRNNITAIIDVPTWMVPVCNKEAFVHEGSEVWNKFVESVETMLCEYWRASKSPEKLEAFSESLRTRLHECWNGTPSTRRIGGTDVPTPETL
eukprot:Lankesteria_metandrocarpae@DN4995_c0_g1_i2.p1